MKKLQLSIIASLMCFSFFGQLTYVPDDAFEAWIEDHHPSADNGIVNDNYVFTSGIDSVDMIVIDVSLTSYLIHDFTGIEDFPLLQVIQLVGNPASIIDLSQVNLQNLLTIDIKNSSLQTLKLPNAPIQVLSLYGCPQLTNIISNTNTSFSGSNLAIGISSCNSLQVFDISNVVCNAITGIIGIQLCNNLNCVKINNGSCSIYTQVGFQFCPLLNCVSVDNPNYSSNSATWMWLNNGINEINNYTTSCSCSAAINETELKTVSISPNPTSSSVSIQVPTELVGKSWSLYDQTGRLQQSGVYTGTESEIILESYNPGIYIMRSDEAFPFKIIKE